jgi:hypothetical protein
MLLLIPVLVLFLSAAAVLVLQRLRPGLGNAWAVSTGAAFLVWLFFLIVPLKLFSPLVVDSWIAASGQTGRLAFLLDNVSWVYVFSLATLLLAVLITASTRLRSQNQPAVWAGSLGITAVGFLVISANTLLTLVLAWTAIDILELVIVLAISKNKNVSGQTLLSFFFRVSSSFLVIWAMILSYSHGTELTLANSTSDVSIYLLIAAVLRLGVLPLRSSEAEETPLSRGLGTILLAVSPASSFMLLTHLPANVVSSSFTSFLLVVVAVVGIYGAARWAFASDEIKGRPYILVTLAAVAITCVTRQHPEAVAAWGEVYLLSVSVLFLYSERNKGVMWVALLGLFGASALPVSPSNFGWIGLFPNGFDFHGALYLLVVAVMLFGYFKHLLRPEGNYSGLDRWIQRTYPAGLLLLTVAQGIIFYKTFPASFKLQYWWAGAAATILALTGMLVWNRVRQQAELSARQNLYSLITSRISIWLSSLLSFDWLYRILEWVYGVVLSLVQVLTVTLEGEGGVLWALVLLALLISIIKTGVVTK